MAFYGYLKHLTQGDSENESAPQVSSDIESCKSFDSFGDVLPIRSDEKNKSFVTAHSNEDEDTASSGGRRPPNPFANASLISKLLFIWPYSLMVKKDNQDEEDCSPAIEESDLPDVLDCDSSEVNLRKFQELWEKEKERAAKVMQQHKAKEEKSGTAMIVPKAATPSLAHAIKNDFLSTLWFIQPCMFASAVGKLVQALALGFLLQSFELQDGKGYIWAGLLVLSGLVVLMSHHHCFWWTTQKGMQYRISAVAAIYDKTLRLKSSSVDTTISSGRAINLATNDVERFLLSSMFAVYIIWAPILSLGILGLGWHIIGWPFAVGFVLLVCVVVPFQLFLSKMFAALRSEIAAITDERVTLVSQAVAGARVMKMYNYEESFVEKISSIRKREVASIQRVNRYRALNESIFFVANVFTAVVIFLVHVSQGGRLTPMNVYSTFVLINVAQMEITKYLALAVMGVSEANVSISRIQKFLETRELSSTEVPIIGNDSDRTAIVVSRATCHWNSSGTSSEEPASLKSLSYSSSSDDIENNAFDSTGLAVALSNVNLSFDMGALTCIIGEVGSAKSALIQMLAGELPLSSGHVRKRAGSTLAFAAQDSFIVQGSVRENIVFGRPYDETAYQNVVNACGLNVDFVQLSEGEDTMVGDRGVNLSGGQKARIALARTFYQDADIILLDDPLSAVDSKVGRQLFAAIQSWVKRAGKCVVLVTHQHQYIGESRCVVMRGGRVVCVGSYQTCADASGLTLAVQNKEAAEDSEVMAESSQKDNVNKPGKDTSKDQSSKKRDKACNDEDHKETGNVGVVKMGTFISYCRALPGGILSGFFMLLIFTLTQGAAVASVAVAGRWSVLPDQTSGDIIGAIVGLVLSVAVLALIRAFLYYHLVIEASKNLHDAMTKSVVRAKIDFFDTNPLGRILNRFSADVGSNDDLLPNTLFEFLMIGFMVLGAIASTCSVLPVTLIFVPPICVCLIRVRKIFVNTSRELKRMEGLARSPIFALLSESLNGISTIRCSNGGLEHFQQKFRDAHNAHGRACFAFAACTRWFGFRCDACMFTFIAISSFAAVVVNDKAWLDIDPSVLGLALTSLIQMSGLFQYGIRQSAEVVNQMVSVERVIGYRDLSSEAALANQYDDEVDKGWPKNGTIDVKGLNVRYRPGLPLSLRGLNFRIEGGSRVGVVGRTGCGKSTLVQSILRLLEAEDTGQIVIDSVDIAKIGLSKLRRSISVIPQFPVLYGGMSLRNNLDLFNDRSDEDIHEALVYVSMLDPVHSLPQGLDTIVTEGGSNFSVGQRQLLCLARAILRRNKVLILDEPTANVDSRTDKLLQEAVAENFEGATILAIAHRLDTVIDYDKILVLGSGGVLEYGSPHELIVAGGAFCSMVDDTGNMADILKARAKKDQ